MGKRSLPVNPEKTAEITARVSFAYPCHPDISFLRVNKRAELLSVLTTKNYCAPSYAAGRLAAYR